jgi:hypothetical protein
MRPSPLHAWVRPIDIAYLPGALTPAVEQVAGALLDWLRFAGCTVRETPGPDTELILTTSRHGLLTSRDDALFFHAKRRFRLARRPTTMTIVDVPEADYQRWLAHFSALALQPEDALAPERYPGLGPHAVEVIAHQARRGGPELAFSRLLQAQNISVRVLALRTQAGRPYRAMHFDLAGARPVTDATDLDAFAADAGPRVLAAVCAQEVKAHSFVDPPVPAEKWAALAGPDAMIRAGTRFTEFGFFTTPFYVDKLLGYRGLSDAISAQYSEGCYAVFEPDLGGLITTATGSSRLVDKRSISRADQAVIVGLRPGREGALVRPVAGFDLVLPSVEAVEMLSIAQAIPTHTRQTSQGEPVLVPNLRALLHGHLGVGAYDPNYVEAVQLDPLYYQQLVSCGTGALAQGTAAAFARSSALRRLDDPRRLVFLEQPGHGVMVAEKWPVGAEPSAPFDTIYDYLQAGHIQMTLDIPQGPVAWETVAAPDGRTLEHKLSGELEHAA